MDVSDNSISIPLSNIYQPDSHSSSDTVNADTDIKIDILHTDNLPIDIQEEEVLTQYTNNHFISITNKELERVRKLNTVSLHLPDESFEYIASRDSPVLSVLDSNMGSRSNSNSNSDDDDENAVPNSSNPLGSHSPIHTNLSNLSSTTLQTFHRPHRKRYNKVSFHDIEQSIRKCYTPVQNHSVFSSELDILTTFVKGQKHLYAQSKVITQQKLNCLLFPAIIISAFITIISPFVECKSWNVGIISGLNAIVTLFISTMNLLKYESAIEMFSLLASLFDNIETSLELTSSKLMLLQNTDTSELVLSKYNEVETKISDYKLTNAVLIPEEIKRIFPIISHVNIFSFIKKTELHKKMLIEKLRDIKNEIYYILYKMEKQARVMNRLTDVPPSPSRQHTIRCEQERLAYLYTLKEQTRSEIIEFQQTYSVMDTIFTREIAFAEQAQNKWWFCLLCYYWNPPNTSYDYLNGITPTLSSYFHDNIINEYTLRK
jgi:hypothetical protein